MKLYTSGEDYLETILVLRGRRPVVRAVDIARHMNISKPSVSYAVGLLRDGGYLTVDEDHFIHLTAEGNRVAEKIYERHCFFRNWLIRIGVEAQTAETDACKMEHCVSEETFEKLKQHVVLEQAQSPV